MNPKIQEFKGILRVSLGRSYLATPLATMRSLPLFLSLPTGAAFFEGFKAGTHYLQRTMNKHNGDRVTILGVKARLGKRSIIQFSPQAQEGDIGA